MLVVQLLYFVSEKKMIANLQHAREAGCTEVVLLDPTLNQRKDFDGSLRLLARENHDQQFAYFGELRAEEGKQFPFQCRKKGSLESPEDVLLDVNSLVQAAQHGTTETRGTQRNFPFSAIRIESSGTLGNPCKSERISRRAPKNARKTFDFLENISEDNYAVLLSMRFFLQIN